MATDGDEGPGSDLSTDEILSAFQAKRRRGQDSKPSAEAASAPEDGPSPFAPPPRAKPARMAGAPATEAAASPPAPPSTPSGNLASASPPAAQPVAPTTHATPPVPAPIPNPAVPPPQAPSPAAAERAIAVAPASPAPGLMQPALSGQPLTALSPVLRLSDRLLQDKELAVRGSRSGRIAGVATALVGLLVVVLDRWLTAAGFYPAIPLTDTPMLLLGAALVVVGALLAAACLVLPPHRRLRIRLAPNQAEEWARVQADAAKLRSQQAIGLALAVVGLLLAAVAFTYLAPPVSTAVGGLGVVVAVAGGTTLLAAAMRRATLQRLYVQTLVLAALEQTGLGPAGKEADARVAPVLKALDQLLGALPESAVRRFLASPEAEAYLELMEDVNREGGKGA